MTHAAHSPSGADYWGHCPQWVSTPGTNDAAILGTHKHTLLSACIENQQWDARTMVGFHMQDHEGDFTVDMDMVNHVNMVLHYVKERSGGDWLKIISEVPVDPGEYTGRSDTKGTADVVITSDDWLEVIDAKFGYTPVSEQTFQLDLYGAGVLSNWYRSPLSYDPVYLTIAQPTCIPTIKTRKTTSSAVILNARHLGNRADEHAAGDRDPIPGEKQCKYCGKKTSCRKYVESLTEKLNMIPTDMVVQSADKNPETMTDAELREIAEAAPALRALFEKVDEELLNRFKAGKPVEGMKVVRGRGSVAWSLSEDETAKKLKMMGLPLTAIYPKKLISPAQAKKATWTKKGDEKVQTLSPRQVQRLESELTTYSKGKLKVVSESDPGEPVTLGPDLTTLTKPEPAAPPSWLG